MRTYEKYKDSGISWIGKVPEDWDICKFKHTINIRNGKDYKDVQSDNHNDYPVYGSGGVFAYAKKYLYDGEALLLGRKGTIDKPIYIRKGKFWTVDTMFYGLATNGNVCKYLYYQALTFPFGRYATSTALPSMTQSDLGNNPICLPPIPEQEAIANYLDKKTAEIDKIIAEREKKIELLNELKSSIISRAVTKGINPHAKMKDSGIDWIGVIPEGWDVCHLKAVFKLKTGTTPKFFEEDKSINKVDWYTPGDFNEDFILGNSKRKLDKETFETNNFDYFPANSILLVGIGTAGKVACTSKKCYSNQQITALLPNRNLNSLYIMLYLRGISDYLLKTAPYTTLPILSNAYMSRVNILLPPLEEQNNIVQHVLSKTRKMEHDINLIQSEITLLREYKQSLISEVVTGKRKVID